MRFPVIAVALIVPLDFGLLHAQESSLLEGSARAQAVLDKALAAYGGRDRVVAAARQFTWVLEGELIHRHQSPSAENFVTTPFRMVMAGDLDAGRFRSDRRGSYPGGFNWHLVDLLDSGTTRQANLDTRTSTSAPGANVENYQAQLERLPQAILARLDRQRRGLAWGGEVTVDGKKRSTILAPVNAGVLGRYSFDDSGLLLDAERLMGDDLEGDAVMRIHLADYRADGGTMVPGVIEQSTAGVVTIRVRPRLELLGQVPADSFFALPAGITDMPRQAPAAPAFESVGPGVFLASGMAGGYRLLVADLGDHLAVVESPNGSEQSGRAVAMIQKQFPGKPIRYVVPTHHHDDHAGGLRAFIAAGAIVVTTPGNEALFRRMAVAPYTLQPDEQARVRKPVRFEFVKGRRVLSGGGTTLELHDIGPSPHADEMLIAYVPATRFVFQGDLFNTGAGDPTSWGNLTTVHFVDWIGKSGLEVEKIGGTHSAVRTREDLDAAARRVQQTASH